MFHVIDGASLMAVMMLKSSCEALIVLGYMHGGGVSCVANFCVLMSP